MMRRISTTALVALIGTALFQASQAQSAETSAAEFYKNIKQMKMIISASPGGSYDTYARLLARHFGDQLPGKPSIVSMNIPGASGIKAANYVAQQAPHDGSILTNVRYNFAMYQALDNLPAVKTDMRDFNWIGGFNATNHVLFVYHTAPAKTFEDAKKTQVLIGQASPRSFGTLMCKIYNAVLGTKLKVITGYGGIARVKLAMQRGEVQGIGDNGWTDLKSDFHDMLKNKEIKILMQVGLKKEPDLPNVPLLIDQAGSVDEKAILDFVTKSDASMGKPFATSPGVSAERVAFLRSTFDKTMKDEGLLKDAHQLNVEVQPISGTEVQQIVADIMSAPQNVTDKLRDALGITTPRKGR